MNLAGKFEADEIENYEFANIREAMDNFPELPKVRYELRLTLDFSLILYLRVIERKLPVVRMCTIVSISQTVGANRIVPTIAIPHPFGDPSKTPEEEKALRRKLVEHGLKALQTEIT